ncbi:MAG: phosphoglucomutase/phosphomannomutase family protein [Candidatus Omnitrophica bacterium]|nr:phosphoglucomutase/phosphomannomutase family protein [Candidatus Omnitrophota bacterium]MDD5237114.1 phosphoglucomutase/phosphomannomutase family protein [Candidatus Omnitrophota bacterium]MDD5610152.1 phosphoglucomutase/phosphomannomutase family protein [Candidatus Omnitrophota bacterium]
MHEIRFGTDGWRGIISDDFTFENVARVAQAIADYYKKTKPNERLKFVVGFDTRFLSDKYAELVSKVLSANGIEVLLSDRPVPTPVVSLTAEKRKLSGGVMITASHNPAAYNGIKIKTGLGQAAGVEITRSVEGLIKVYDPEVISRANLNLIKKEDLTRDFVKFLRSYVDLKKLKNAKYRVLVDAMHGSGDKFFAEVLKGTKIKLEFTRSDINPSFEGLRPEPIVENLQATIAKMKKEKFDLCLVLDGDADRIAAIGPGGEYIPPQKILGLLYLHLFEDRGFTGGLVKTICGTTMIDHIARKKGIKLYETPVGFKYISDLMVREDVLVGGEEAGGMGFKNYVPERDGTLAGLLLLEMMVYRKKAMLSILKEVEKAYGQYYYLREDLKVKSAVKLDMDGLKSLKEILGRKVVQIKDYDGIKFILDDESWLMLRASGTEPLVRIYAENKDIAKTKKYLDFGKELISRYAL